MSEITKKLLENTSKPLGAPALLVLEDGAVFSGTSCAAQGEVFGEICFNTSLEGYLEVITDPSYAGQIITMTYPQIGNYGVNREDCQSEKPALRGLVVRDMCQVPSNWRCELIAVPWDTPAEDVLAMNPDGVFLSNGPGDPDAVSGTYTQVEKLLGKVPVFGICLGHQMMSKAAGAQIEKLKFGHRGGNHPVMNLRTHRVEITAQNHGFGLLFPTLGELIPEESAGETEHRDDLRFWVEKRVAPVVRNEKFGRIQLTHVNLNDGTAEGIAFLDIPAFSVQYHPEASPGPTDAHYLFTAFSRLMDGREDYLDIDIAADRLAGWKFGGEVNA